MRTRDRNGNQIFLGSSSQESKDFRSISPMNPFSNFLCVFSVRYVQSCRSSCFSWGLCFQQACFIIFKHAQLEFRSSCDSQRTPSVKIDVKRSNRDSNLGSIATTFRTTTYSMVLHIIFTSRNTAALSIEPSLRSLIRTRYLQCKRKDTVFDNISLGSGNNTVLMLVAIDSGKEIVAGAVAAFSSRNRKRSPSSRWENFQSKGGVSRRESSTLLVAHCFSTTGRTQAHAL